jgi:hypothetical protein
MRGLLLLAAFAALSGCAETPIYDHVDLTGKIDPAPNQELFQRELADCKTRGAMVPGNSVVDAMITVNVIKNCMRSKGWIKHES